MFSFIQSTMFMNFSLIWFSFTKLQQFKLSTIFRHYSCIQSCPSLCMQYKTVELVGCQRLYALGQRIIKILQDMDPKAWIRVACSVELSLGFSLPLRNVKRCARLLAPFTLICAAIRCFNLRACWVARITLISLHTRNSGKLSHWR